MKYWLSQGIQRLFKVLGAYKNRWLCCDKRNIKDKVSSFWHLGGRETGNRQIEKLKYWDFLLQLLR